jgi:DNA-binding transcriptional regulator WhiA
MGRAERDLVAALRAELAAIDPSRACDRAAESAGLAGSRADRKSIVARLLVRLRRADSQGRVAVEALTEAASRTAPSFNWETAADHCRLAWLRGRFLARGSLSVAGGRTHLEFVVDPDEAPVLASRLADVGLPASWRVRRGRGVVTWKSAETVGTFLRRIGAGSAMLELEARQVSRALRGELNRILNAESANLQRAVNAAGRQLAAIAQLEADGRLATQPYGVRLVAEARRETPEATLTELAGRLGLHRSAVQRALDRIETLVLHETERRRPRSRPTSGGWRCRPRRTATRGAPAPTSLSESAARR